MALVKCGECGAEISDKAAACVKCGAPVETADHETKPPQSIKAVPPVASKSKGKTGCGPIVIAFLLIVGYAIYSSSSDDKKGGASEPSKEAACAKDDLSCLGNKGVIAAGIYCKDPVERLAKHSVKWTDGTFDMKFSRFRWADKRTGVVTYIGDKAQFQNGFGAYTNVVYECDLANDGKSVIDVRVEEGRLPH
ncbi:zinc-ribbon domain-containing protein [Caballeronia sp. Sq4a]|uniref:zinc-ribbon domain-containing protein n=1 Tax=Caballeronia sp. Sq4a TaxID=2878152 RepID=UPI0020C05B83|nr:zinc-ribbon domain-containing protein [Caballeronia sp. Sq4a]